MEIKQSLKLSQSLVITPQLQQAIKLLQLSRLELTTLIEKELIENPVLEEDNEEGEQTKTANGSEESQGELHEKAKEEDRGHEHNMEEVGSKDGDLKEPSNFDWENYIGSYNVPGQSFERASDTGEEFPTYENTLTQTESLQAHLSWQLGLSLFSPEECLIGAEIIGNINEDGYLTATLEEVAEKIGATAEQVEAVLKKIQEFDPPGVGARDLKECLLLQCKQFEPKTQQLISRMIDQHLGDLEKHHHKPIAKSLNIPLEKVEELAKMIHELEPKPGRPYGQNNAQYITPDVHIHKMGNEYVVSLNEDGLPKLAISPLYRRAMMQGSEVKGKEKEYIQDKLRSALWLIKSIHQRQRTMYKVAKSIVKFQRDFFDKGPTFLKPMVLKDVADDIGMHESTISRVTTNKFVHTPRGIFELKYFFNSSIQNTIGNGTGVASEAVKEHLQKLICEEDPKKPLSDQDIADMLKQKNQIEVARRTVAKYREILGILPSSRRRRH